MENQSDCNLGSFLTRYGSRRFDERQHDLAVNFVGGSHSDVVDWGLCRNGTSRRVQMESINGDCGTDEWVRWAASGEVSLRDVVL